MPRFSQKPAQIEAVQWVKRGDHPAVTPFSNVERACPHCNMQWNVHGLVPGAVGQMVVCPGDWIIADLGSPLCCLVIKPDVFRRFFESA